MSMQSEGPGRRRWLRFLMVGMVIILVVVVVLLGVGEISFPGNLSN